MSTAGRVAGKAALITGGAQGLGEAIAWMLAREGSKVAITDINGAGVAALAARINAEIPGSAFGFTHDVASEAEWIDVVDKAARPWAACRSW